MQVGSLVKIKQSFSQRMIGKLAVVLRVEHPLNATIHIIDTGVEKEWDTRKLELVCK